jgi:starch synthase
MTVSCPWAVQRDAAARLGISERTLHRWRTAGLLQPGEHYRRKFPNPNSPLLYHLERCEHTMSAAAARHPGRVGIRIGYDEALSHRMQAGGDAILIPSRFEPCGLTQLYGLKYVSLPLVRRVGGLADTVVDTDLETLDNHSATGFVFDDFDSAPYQRALRRAFALYRRRADWSRVRQNGMRIASGWEQSAMQYRDLYASLISPT